MNKNYAIFNIFMEKFFILFYFFSKIIKKNYFVIYKLR